MTRLSILTVTMLCLGAGGALAQDAAAPALTLEQMVQAGVAHNPSVRAATAGSQAADASAAAARASLFPG